MLSLKTNTTNTLVSTQQKTAALYARVSTSDQEDQETIQNQLIEIRERIKADHNLLPPEFEFLDDGWTGTILERPGLDAMRDTAAKEEFQILYVYDRGRIARDFVYQEVVIRELADKGIQFVTLKDPPGDTPEQKVMQGMYGLFAEYERIKILERTRRGRIRKANDKVLMSGQAQYGYDRVPKTNEQPAHWTINKTEQEIVYMIFDWVGKELMTINSVQKKLYELGIPTKKRKGVWWSKGVIARMLKQKTYITGEHYYNTSEAVPSKNPLGNGYKKVKNSSKRARPESEWILEQNVPILLDRPGDKELFEKVQKILTHNKKYATKKQNHNYLLSGFVFCECGKPRSGDGSSRHGHHYYRCTERIYVAPDKRECASMGVNADALDQAFWDKLVQLTTAPDLLKEQARKWIDKQAQRQAMSDTNEQNIIKKIAQIEDEEERYQRAYGEGVMNFTQLKKLSRDCRNRKASLGKQLKEHKQKTQDKHIIKEEEIDALCSVATTTLQKLDFGNKKAIIRDLIDRIIIKGQKEIEVWGHIPLNTERLGSYVEGRNCWIAKRRKVDAF